MERELFLGLAEMLVHDAIVGMQDRHHENWGVIVRRDMPVAPRFAPLYDSAARLFGERHDSHLAQQFAGPRFGPGLDHYIRRSTPLFGIEGHQGNRAINHIELVSWLFWHYPEVRSAMQRLLSQFDSRRLMRHIRLELGTLCSPRRAEFIRCCVKRRIDAINRGIALSRRL